MHSIFEKVLPFWNKLSIEEKKLALVNTISQKVEKGRFFHYDGSECMGLQIVISGRIRVFINSSNGAQITLYRLGQDDICILSAACMIKNLDFDVHMEVEEDSEFYIITQNAYKQLSESNGEVKDFTLELIASRFSDVMWLMKQLVFSNMGSRLSQALMEHAQLSGGNVIFTTHEVIAKDLGTAREVVTRLLKQFQLDGIVLLSRGSIKILDINRLRKM